MADNFNIKKFLLERKLYEDSFKAKLYEDKFEMRAEKIVNDNLKLIHEVLYGIRDKELDWEKDRYRNRKDKNPYSFKGKNYADLNEVLNKAIRKCQDPFDWPLTKEASKMILLWNEVYDLEDYDSINDCIDKIEENGKINRVDYENLNKVLKQVLNKDDYEYNYSSSNQNVLYWEHTPKTLTSIVNELVKNVEKTADYSLEELFDVCVEKATIIIRLSKPEKHLAGKK